MIAAAAASARRQAAAYLAADAAKKAYDSALDELRAAEQARVRPAESLTIIIDSQAVTPRYISADNAWEYLTSKIV